MPTASEEIAARRAKYAETKYEVDALGRRIGVCRLLPSQQTRVQELTPGLDGNTSVQDDDPDSPTFGKTFDMPKRGPMVIAASVRSIDGTHVPFPKTRMELDAMLDRLDDEGLQAASIALAQFTVKKDEPDPERKTPEEQAKN